MTHRQDSVSHDAITMTSPVPCMRRPRSHGAVPGLWTSGGGGEVGRTQGSAVVSGGLPGAEGPCEASAEELALPRVSGAWACSCGPLRGPHCVLAQPPGACSAVRDRGMRSLLLLLLLQVKGQVWLSGRELLVVGCLYARPGVAPDWPDLSRRGQVSQSLPQSLGRLGPDLVVSTVPT